MTGIVTYADFVQFQREYYHENKYPHERLGQAFMNHVSKMQNVKDNELFFAADDNVAMEIIWEKYVKAG